jgi:hypothetical protein
MLRRRRRCERKQKSDVPAKGQVARKFAWRKPLRTHGAERYTLAIVFSVAQEADGVTARSVSPQHFNLILNQEISTELSGTNWLR